MFKSEFPDSPPFSFGSHNISLLGTELSNLYELLTGSMENAAGGSTVATLVVLIYFPCQCLHNKLRNIPD
jgi:hypothetical protein